MMIMKPWSTFDKFDGNKVEREGNLSKMRFKTSNLKEPKHTDLVSCVSWLSPDDVVSAGDDRRLNKWNLVSGETTLVGELPEDFHPTDMHMFPRGQGRNSIEFQSNFNWIFNRVQNAPLD